MLYANENWKDTLVLKNTFFASFSALILNFSSAFFLSVLFTSLLSSCFIDADDDGITREVIGLGTVLPIPFIGIIFEVRPNFELEDFENLDDDCSTPPIDICWQSSIFDGWV